MDIKSQKGQMTVEMVLILTFLTFTSYWVLNKFDADVKPVKQFVVGPWETVKGMMESGIWAKRGAATEKHPNYFKRMYSEWGEKVPD